MSLGDAYDIEGSVIGIEQLETREVHLVHEMGATMFSERFSGLIRKVESGDIAQSTAWGVVVDDLPDHPFRVLGIEVFVDTGGRVNLATLSAREPTVPRETPMWNFDNASDSEVEVMFSDDGGPGAATPFLEPGFSRIPSLLAGAGQPQRVNDIVFRGLTTAFGAGTVEAIALIHIGFVAVGGVSSRGLPLPSW